MGRKVIMKIIRESSVPNVVYAPYKQVIASFPKVLISSLRHGTGLFAGKNIEKGRYVLEYTGNRINRKKTILMYRSLDRLELSPYVFVHV